MERSLRILIVSIALLFAFCSVNAEEISAVNPLITPQTVEYKFCTRTYIITPEKLFFMAVAAINANKFQIEELQSKTGYILFTAAGKQYLASVVKVDSTRSMIKITPTSNSYFFAPGIVLNVFRYIDLMGSTPVVPLNKK